MPGAVLSVPLTNHHRWWSRPFSHPPNSQVPRLSEMPAVIVVPNFPTSYSLDLRANHVSTLCGAGGAEVVYSTLLTWSLIASCFWKGHSHGAAVVPPHWNGGSRSSCNLLLAAEGRAGEPHCLVGHSAWFWSPSVLPSILCHCLAICLSSFRIVHSQGQRPCPPVSVPSSSTGSFRKWQQLAPTVPCLCSGPWASCFTSASQP